MTATRRGEIDSFIAPFYHAPVHTESRLGRYIRCVTPAIVEQVFLTRKGGATEVLFVLEDAAGGRTRDRLTVASLDDELAVRQAARLLAYRGVVAGEKVRLRVSRGDELIDDGALLALFLDELG